MFTNNLASFNKKEEPLGEVKRMTSFDRISYYTGFHRSQETYLDPAYNLNTSFTERALEANKMMMGLKVGLITGGSAVFGLGMGFIMSSFEFNSSRVVDTDRTSTAQLKQYFFGYSRFLKRQSLHFARFGLYISLIEIRLEIVWGRLNSPAIFISGGLAAVLQTRYTGFANAFSAFMGSGIFIGAIGLFMHRGKD